MPTIDATIDVRAPLERVYAEWARFDRFPEFMDNVREVRPLGNGGTHWVADVAGGTIEWDATTHLDPPREVAWTATGGAGHSGRVSFDELGDGRTRVHVHLTYTLPSRVREVVAETLRIDERAVAADLRNFARRVERA